MQRAVDRALAEHGRIDIAVSGAGVVSGTRLEDIDDEDWARVIDINLKGTLHVLQAVYPPMREAGSGKIVCIGSIAAQQGGVSSGPHYVAAKAGVHGMVKWLAKDAAQHGVTVNVVSPGPVMTPMWIGLNDGVEEDGPQYSPLGRGRAPRGRDGGRALPRLADGELDHGRHARRQRRPPDAVIRSVLLRAEREYGTAHVSRHERPARRHSPRPRPPSAARPVPMHERASSQATACCSSRRNSPALVHAWLGAIQLGASQPR